MLNNFFVLKFGSRKDFIILILLSCPLVKWHVTELTRQFFSTKEVCSTVRQSLERFPSAPEHLRGKQTNRGEVRSILRLSSRRQGTQGKHNLISWMTSSRGSMDPSFDRAKTDPTSQNVQFHIWEENCICFHEGRHHGSSFKCVWSRREDESILDALKVLRGHCILWRPKNSRSEELEFWASQRVSLNGRHFYNGIFVNFDSCLQVSLGVSDKHWRMIFNEASMFWPVATF